MSKSRFCSRDKVLQKKVRELVREGWKMKRTGKHFRLTSPTGISCSVSSSPSDRMASNNVIRDINCIKEGKIQLLRRSHMI